MSDHDSDTRKLRALIDTVEADILNSSDEEILEDIRSHEDPNQVVKRTKDLVQSAIMAHRQKKLFAAREAYDAETQGRPKSVIPSDPVARRSLLQRLVYSGEGLPKEVTVAFREGQAVEGMADEDVESMLEDLADLGFLGDGSRND